MSVKNKKIARQVLEDIQSEGNLALIDKLVAKDYVGHTPPADFQGPEGAREFTVMLRSAFPDMHLTVEDQIAEGDRVATRWTGSGTHDGEFQGVPPTGKPVTMSGITVFRIVNGKLIEGWNRPNMLGIMQQIGALAVPS
jgi:steroid delta-isomerase-like uncharacterized protein